MRFFLFFCVCFYTISLFGECPVTPISVPPPTEAAISFYKSGNILWGVKQLLALLFPLIVLLSGLSKKMVTFSHFLGKNKFFTFILFIFFYSLLIAIFSFPLSFYQGFIRLQNYGLSSQNFSRWFFHHLISFSLTTLMSLGVFAILYVLITKSPKRWWFYMGLLLVPLQLFLQVIHPIYIAPLFNKFGPMENKVLERQILALAEKAGIENSRIFQVNKSADTKMMNAYVNGVGNTKRIVLWDTIIEGLTAKELLFVMGHEMGHYVLNHIWWGIAVNSLLALLILFLIHFSAKLFLKYGSFWMGFNELKDFASVPLIIFLYTFFSLFFLPIENRLSQMKEHDADRFGLEITHYNQEAGSAFLKLTKSNLGYPYPGKFFMLFRSSHPSIGSRIEFFNTYHPYCEGQPSKYQKYFKDHIQSLSRDTME